MAIVTRRAFHGVRCDTCGKEEPIHPDGMNHWWVVAHGKDRTHFCSPACVAKWGINRDLATTAEQLT